ncbi:MAG: carboxypeptidase regulatory-like domain-containing protein, partial [Pseudomonadota bacterium]
MRVNPGETVDPSLTLAAGLVGLERTPGVGTAVVTGVVTSSDFSRPVADATVYLHRAGGTLLASATTDLGGTFRVEKVPAGTYYLVIEAPLHFPYSSAPFEVEESQTVTLNVLLTHNHSLTITKTADATDVEAGDVVGFTIVVTATGVETVSETVVIDDLPVGLRLIPGTGRIGAKRVSRDPPGGSDVLKGRRVTFPLGTLAPGQKETIYYEALVVAGAKVGALTNSARAIGMAAGVAVHAGPTYARVFVHDGDTGERSLLFGRVFLDKNGSGFFEKNTDQPIQNASVLLDDGTMARADFAGRYSIRGVSAGAHAVMAVVPRTPDANGLVAPGPSRLAAIDLRHGVAEELNFAFAPDEVKQWVNEAARNAATTIGNADTTVSLSFGATPTIHLAGRVAGFAEHDLGKDYRITAYLDTAHDHRDERTVGRDKNFFQPEVGDFSTVTPSVPDKLGVRLNAPWGNVLLGRGSVGFGESELLNNTRSFLGLEAEVLRRQWGARVFAGVTDAIVVIDVFANDGTTGPFQLSAIPVVQGSDRLFVEARASNGQVTRAPLSKDDYSLDSSTGRLFLHRPWPLISASGDSYYFVVLYESIPASELPSALIAGGRAEARIASHLSVGASAVVEDAEPARKKAAGIDAQLKTEHLEVIGEAAVSSAGSVLPGDLPGEDPTALRVRGIYSFSENFNLYGYTERVGGGYNQDTNFRFVSPPEQQFGNMPPPFQSVISQPVLRAAFNGPTLGPAFPFSLSGAADQWELGIGADYRPRPDVGITSGIYRTTENIEDSPGQPTATRYTNYASALYTPRGYPAVFVGTAGTTGGNPLQADQSLYAGSRYATKQWSVGTELKLSTKEGSGIQEQMERAALLRARWRKLRWLQPGALVLVGDQTRTNDGALLGRTNMLALGLETSWPSVEAYAYSSVAESERYLGQGETVKVMAAFAGASFTFQNLVSSFRVDASNSNTLGLRYGCNGRIRAFLTEEVSIYGTFQYSAGDYEESTTFWDHLAGLSYRPSRSWLPRLFLKYRDRTMATSAEQKYQRRSRLGAIDLVFPLLRIHGSLATRGALKRVHSIEGDMDLAVAAEELTITLRKRYQIIAGGRLASSTNSGEVVLGSTLGAGMVIGQG